MSWKRLGRILLAGPVAALVVALVFILFTGSIAIAIFAFYFALFFGALVGFPLFIVAQRTIPIGLISTSVIGFVTGAVPVAIFTWPPNRYAFESFKAMDGTMYSIDGVTTFAGWLHFAQDLLPLGLLGAIAGAVFFFILKVLGDPLTPGLASSTISDVPEQSAT